jgi:hypothetical protein
MAEAPASATATPSFSPETQRAHQAVLESDRWMAARTRFEQWLSVQSAYDANEIADIKRRLTERVAAMSAVELQKFLAEMEQRLDVLLSPDVTAARNWADEFYTPLGKEELAAQYGVAHPLSMTGEELNAALARFALDRQSHASTRAAFQQQQATQAAAAREYRQAQQQAAQQAAAASAARRPASSGAPYAPTRRTSPQRYEAPYNPLQYSIGPWGGIWIGH